MNPQLILEQISKLLKRINKKQRIVILTTFLVLISFLTYLILFRIDEKTDYEGYSVLFNGIDPSDSAAILQNLQQNKIPYKLPNDTTILVPNDQVYEQRINLASLGIPKQGKKLALAIS